MKNFFRILSVSFLVMVGIFSVVSCEDETVGLGGSVIGGEAEGRMKSLDVIAYNSNFDTLRTDRFVLQNGAFGVYNENVFGTTSSKFYSQLRPSSIGNMDFGTETQVDSVNLFIPVYYNASKAPISKDTINLSNPGKVSGDNDTILIKTKYAVDSIYGNKDLKMTLKVRDINSVLYTDSKYFSKLRNPEPLFSVNSKVLGTVKIGNTVENKVIKKKSDLSVIYEERIGYKISLDKDYFYNKIIKNSNTGLLSDYSTFIRENIRGFEFSVDENNGFIVNFNPNFIDLKMYYSYKNPNTMVEGQANYKPRLSSSYTFNFLNQWTPDKIAGSNIVASQIYNDYSNSTYANIKGNHELGDSRLFLNGMSGTNVRVRLKSDQLVTLKEEMAKNGTTIIGARLKFFIDDSYNFPKPPYITAWNSYLKDNNPVSEMYADMLEFTNAYPTSVHFNPIVKGKTDFYTIDITKHLKSMLEKGNPFEKQEMVVTMGNFITAVSTPTTINSKNPYQNNRAYNPYRIVLHGNQSEIDAKKLKLLVYYSAK